MGINLDEVEPVLGLDREGTRGLARCLLYIADPWTRQISFKMFRKAIEDLAQRQKMPASLKNVITDEAQVAQIAQDLKKAGWFVENDFGFIPAKKIIDVLNAINAPRMTFNEARDQIVELIDRLNDAPGVIDGIRIERILLYGSAIRDKNPRETIGDLDLIIVASFDDPYKYANPSERDAAIYSAWGKIISNDDERIGLRSDLEFLHHVFDPDANTRDNHGQPQVLMQLWENDSSSASSLSPAQLQAISTIQSRTLAANERARSVADVINPLAERPELGRKSRFQSELRNNKINRYIQYIVCCSCVLTHK